jgi:NADPH:quinone reductase-like Zn-dependent oxidoreductase
MQAVTIEAYGGPEVLRYRTDAPMPVAGPGEVLVRVANAGINFMDIGTRQGRYENSQSYTVRLPCTLGMEGAGEVISVGEGVTRLAVGDRVAWCIAWGSYAEYAAVPESLTARIPDGVGFDVAAAAMFQGCTAHYLVHDVAQLAEGQTCLVHAAAGAIGQIIVQLARSVGATVFVTASSQARRDVALARGAHRALAYEGFAEEVLAFTGGHGVDVVFDSVGLTTLRESFRATRKRGLVVAYGSVSGSVKDLDPLELGEAGSLFLTRPRLADHMTDGPMVQRRADAIFGAIENETLRVEIAGRYTLADVADAHARLESRQQVGKPVIDIRWNAP